MSVCGGKQASHILTGKPAVVNLPDVHVHVSDPAVTDDMTNPSMHHGRCTGQQFLQIHFIYISLVAYARSRQHRWTYIASSKLWSLEKNIPKTKMAARSSSYKQTVYVKRACLCWADVSVVMFAHLHYDGKTSLTSKASPSNGQLYHSKLSFDLEDTQCEGLLGSGYLWCFHVCSAVGQSSTETCRRCLQGCCLQLELKLPRGFPASAVTPEPEPHSCYYLQCQGRVQNLHKDSFSWSFSWSEKIHWSECGRSWIHVSNSPNADLTSVSTFHNLRLL